MNDHNGNSSLETPAQTRNKTAKVANELSRQTLLMMAIATGLTVASIYYNQPLLEQIRLHFGVSFAAIGWVPTLTQAGYALGMLFLVPLGDMLERKTLVLLFTLLAAAFSALVAFAPNLPVLLTASLLLGASTMTPQLLIPFAAGLSKPSERGKVVGTMMSGLLIGILVARTISGFIGAAKGYQFMFAFAAAVLVVLTGLLYFVLPTSTPSYAGTYSGLLKSVYKIFREQPIVREAGLFGGMLFGAFSAFWATLIHLLETPAFELGARAVGLFGLLGAAAAFASPLIGALADRQDPRRTTRYMICLTIFSFFVYALSSTSLIGIAVGVILMDTGVQAGHISNQSRIFSLMPDAQSRVQTAYMFCYFVGGAVGSLIATWAWAAMGWWGVCLTGAAFGLVALLKSLTRAPQKFQESPN